MPQIAHTTAWQCYERCVVSNLCRWENTHEESVVFSWSLSQREFIEKSVCDSGRPLQWSPRLVFLFPTDHAHCTEADVKPRDQLRMVVCYKKEKKRNCTNLSQLPNVHLHLSVKKNCVTVSFGVSLKIRQVYMVSTHTVKKTITFYQLTCFSSESLSELRYAWIWTLRSLRRLGFPSPRVHFQTHSCPLPSDTPFPFGELPVSMLISRTLHKHSLVPNLSAPWGCAFITPTRKHGVRCSIGVQMASLGSFSICFSKLFLPKLIMIISQMEQHFLCMYSI